MTGYIIIRNRNRKTQTRSVYLGNKYLCPVVDKNEFLSVFNKSYSKKSIKKKIIIKGLTLLDSCIDKTGNIIPGKSTLIISDKDIKQLKFLLALLNSKLPFFYIKEKYPSSSYNQGINFTKEMITRFPIPKPTEKQRESFIALVDKILATVERIDYSQSPAKKDQVRKYEKQIDRLVYKLYNLTPEEIKIIEQNTK